MAKDAAAKSETENAPKKGKSKLILIIVIALLVVLIVVVGAVAALVLLKKGGNEPAAAAPTPAASAHAAVDLSNPPTFVPLDAFTVNLRPDEGDHYLQVAIVLRVVDVKVADGLKAFMPEVRHRVNLLLSSKLPSELATTEGREILADGILEAVNTALGAPPVTNSRDTVVAANGPVQAVLFNSFIIQ